MSTTDNGGPAFPVPAIGDQAQLPDTGMSLRDWFAGQALAGFITRSGMAQSACVVASQSYSISDAMIEARKAAK